MWRLVVRWWGFLDAGLRSEKLGLRFFASLLMTGTALCAVTFTFSRERPLGETIGLVIGMTIGSVIIGVPGKKGWVVTRNRLEQSFFFTLFMMLGAMGGWAVQEILIPMFHSFCQ